MVINVRGWPGWGHQCKGWPGSPLTYADSIGDVIRERSFTVRAYRDHCGTITARVYCIITALMTVPPHSYWNIAVSYFGIC